MWITQKTQPPFKGHGKSKLFIRSVFKHRKCFKTSMEIQFVFMLNFPFYSLSLNVQGTLKTQITAFLIVTRQYIAEMLVFYERIPAILWYCCFSCQQGIFFLDLPLCWGHGCQCGPFPMVCWLAEPTAQVTRRVARTARSPCTSHFGCVFPLK